MDREIYGHIKGLSRSDLETLRGLYALAVDRAQLVSEDIICVLVSLTEKMRREIAVFLDRHGRVVSVGVGDAGTAPLLARSRRRSDFRLSGLRCVHTHPGGSGMLSSVDMAALLSMRLDAMVALGVRDGRLREAFVAIPDVRQGRLADGGRTYGPMTARELERFDWRRAVDEVEKQLGRTPADFRTGEQPEKALLVSTDSEESLDELARLAEAAGAMVLHKVLQRRASPDAAFAIGRGKVRELALLRQSLGADLVIFDDELTPVQARNLQRELGCRVIDRTALILDIFARRARTREGQLQVELAQLRYLLPRLTGQGEALSRLGGGIGTRGPGETKLETDRRHIRGRIEDLRRELEDVRRHRQQHRRQRQQADIPVVALVGYTNAGKSTLLNALTGADVLVADQLFATLDPTTRRLVLPEKQQVLLTDTVGFVRKLPHQLVAAFRATLEEVQQADLLLHVVDASSADMMGQMAAVDNVLRELNAHNKKTVLVLNKMDCPVQPDLLEQVRVSFAGPVVEVSARTGYGLEQLKQEIARQLDLRGWLFQGVIPYNRADLLALVHRTGQVEREEYLPEGIRVVARLGGRPDPRIRHYQDNTGFTAGATESD
ncbi:MAG: GTPase HflX [Bacillota bacterium]|uniref:GTPase HflX n=1 Tax=Desulfurispora thermophila TaxID=265470 RepID=UPI00035C9DCD|nr:GTPase HflX [Desulfurispora thermophila]